MPFEGPAHRNFFGGIQLFIKSPDRYEGLPRAKQKAPARQARTPVDEDGKQLQASPIQRQRSIETKPAAATDCPLCIAVTAARTTASLTGVSASINTNLSPLAALAPALRVAAICR